MRLSNGSALNATLRSRRTMPCPLGPILASFGLGEERGEPVTTGFSGRLYQGQLGRFQERGLDETLEGRGYDRLWKFPQYLIFGAGEGAHERYAERTWFLGEIHSSWAGLLFNYGIVGASLFSGFAYVLVQRMRDTWFRLMLLGPFMYGFATYSVRNWYFWVGLALVYASSQLKERRRESWQQVGGSAVHLVGHGSRQNKGS